MRSVALTLALQECMAVLTLTFGVACLRVGRRPTTSTGRTAWFLTGATFATVGAVAVVHCTAAMWAVRCGEGSAFYAGYIRVMPPANDARSFVMLGFAAALLALLMRGRAPRRPVLLAWLAAWAVVGAGMGLAEGGFQRATHLSVQSVLDAVTAAVLFVVLYRALVTDALDYLLWLALAAYAVREAMSADFQMLLALTGIAATWKLSVPQLHAAAIISLLVMIGCTLRRLALGRAGKPVPALLERVRR